MTESLGAFLKASRLERGLTAKDVADATRINAKFILAAEEDDFEALPGKVFSKGLLRNLASLLEIDGDDLIRRYEDLDVVVKSEAPELMAVPLDRDPLEPIRPVLIALGIAALPVVLLIYYHFGDSALLTGVFPSAQQTQAGSVTGEEEKETPPQDAPASGSEAIEPVTGEEPVEQEEMSVTSPEETPVAETAPPPASDMPEGMKWRLTIRGVEDTWLKVVIDEENIREIILRKGNEVTWEARDGFVLSIGNVVGAKLFLNGKEFPLTIPANNVINKLALPPAE